MIPSFHIDNQRNGRCGNAEFFGKFVLQLSVFNSVANRLYSSFIKYCIPSFLSALELTFPSGIFRMLFSCSKEKMRWINTRWVVSPWTVVAELQTLRDYSMNKLPRKSMRWNFLSIYAKSTMSTWFNATHPNPARSRFVNKRPKTKFDWTKMLLFMSVRKIPVEKSATVETLNKHLKPFFGCYGGHRFEPLAPTFLKVA